MKYVKNIEKDPQSTRLIILPRGLRLVDRGSYPSYFSLPQSTRIDHGLQLLQLLGWVEFSLPQRRNIGPFIPSPKRSQPK